MHSRKKFKLYCMCALCGTYQYPVSVSDFTDFFRKPPQLNKMQNANMSANVVSRHFCCTRKTIERLWRRFHVAGNIADHPQSGRPCVTTAADDHYIILQHLRNWHLIAAATGRQYGIQPMAVRNRFRQNVQPIRAYQPYFGQILTWRHQMARRDWCRRHLLLRRADWDSILFSDECQFNLKHAGTRELSAVWESVLLMRASLSGTVLEVIQS